LFYDAKDDYAQLSQSGRYFVGGLLEHSSALAAFCAPTPNSYGRLAADPKRFGWSATKKDSLVFIPCGKRNVKEVKRVVFTLPDPSANPYLAFSAIVAAGLDGIKNKTEPGDPAEVESKKRVEKKLPMSLSESISALNSDSKFIKGIISTELLDDFTSLKLKQHSKSLLGVSATEMVEYFNV
jgi:glutamine synthetase